MISHFNLTAMRRILFLLLFCLVNNSLFAFDILNITTLTDRNGLSQNTVRCMLQDSRGFLWMGTINGVNRYNGKEFMTVQLPVDSTFNSLSDKRISRIIEDKNGFIWIRTFSNTLFCYDPRLETFIDYAPENKKKKISNLNVVSNNDIWLWRNQGYCRVRNTEKGFDSWSPNNSKPVSFIFEDSKKQVWIGLRDELLMITGDKVASVLKGTNFYNALEVDNKLYFISSTYIAVFNNRLKSVTKKISFRRNQYQSVSHNRSCLLNKHLIMIATDDGTYAFDTKKAEITSADSFFRNTKLKNASFHTDNKGNIWVSNMSGVLWRHHSGNIFEPLKLMQPEILSLINSERYQIHHDSRDIIWISTFGNGLFAIDQNNGQMYHYTAEKDLSSNYLFCVTEDYSGEIWVGTELAGAIKISLTNYPFDMFYPAPKGKGDRDNAVRLIYEDSEKRFWFGTRDGNLYVCDSLLIPQNTYKVSGGLPFSMAEDTLGYKWLGTKGDGLLIFPPTGNLTPQKYILNDKEQQSSSSNNIFTIMRDTKGRMWIASFGGGLHLAERVDGKLTFRQINMRNQHQDMMRSMIQDKSGLIWVTTNEGVIFFDPEEIIRNSATYNILLDVKGALSPSSNEIRVVFEDSKGRIWLGATGGGLSLLMKEKPLERSRFKHYNAKNGLSNEMIQAIQEDANGYLWISTESGISKFNPQTERFENFIFSNKRYATTIFNELSSWKKKNGELMFGSYNGVYIFNPLEITYNTYAPAVMITGLRINGNQMNPGDKDSPLTQSITITEKITLKYDQNSFNLECTMLNFQAPEFNQYTYYLEGFEKDWNPISRNSTATYRNIPPGSYTFKVKGCNSFGVWNDEETTLQIIIRPPWWKSVWAILLYILVAIAIVYFVSKLIIKMQKLHRAVEVEKQMTEYKLRFFTNISHEFRTPLTIIRGSIESLASLENLPSPVSRQVKVLTKSTVRLMRLIDQLLEFRRWQNNKMELNLEWTEVKNFFYDIYITFKDTAEKKQIEYIFESDENEVNMLLDRSKMDKIVYNLLSNALKHTPENGKVVFRLHFSSVDDTFTLSVSDNGPGIPENMRDMLFVRFKQLNYASGGTGIGLHLTAELVKVHKGIIKYEDSDLGGACFTVSVPLSDKNYDKEDIINQSTKKMTSTIEFDSPDEIVKSDIDKPSKEYKVMVIEDDEDVRNFVKNQLEQYFIVSTASNGLEGMRKVAEEQPNIVVCDVMMPEVDGYEFTKQLKNNFETSHIPVILLTAYSSEEHQLKGIESGADSYITKPFSVKYLTTRIIKLIEQREKLQQKFATEPGIQHPEIAFTDRDKVFLDKLHEIIEENMSNADFKIEGFAQSLAMSRTTFFRKLKGITGYPPNEYVRILRLKKAAELLMDTDMNISEISYQIGISDPFYLSKCFKAQFGKSPSQYRKGK